MINVHSCRRIPKSLGGSMEYKKCHCRDKKVEYWKIVWQLQRESVVYCTRCGAMWKTKASYLSELRQYPLDAEAWHAFRRRLPARKLLGNISIDTPLPLPPSNSEEAKS